MMLTPLLFIAQAERSYKGRPGRHKRWVAALMRCKKHLRSPDEGTLFVLMKALRNA